MSGAADVRLDPPLRVACPKCGAPAGQWCRRKANPLYTLNAIVYVQTHVARAKALSASAPSSQTQEET